VYRGFCQSRRRQLGAERQERSPLVRVRRLDLSRRVRRVARHAPGNRGRDVRYGGTHACVHEPVCGSAVTYLHLS